MEADAAQANLITLKVAITAGAIGNVISYTCAHPGKIATLMIKTLFLIIVSDLDRIHTCAACVWVENQVVSRLCNES